MHVILQKLRYCRKVTDICVRSFRCWFWLWLWTAWVYHIIAATDAWSNFDCRFENSSKEKSALLYISTISKERWPCIWQRNNEKLASYTSSVGENDFLVLKPCPWRRSLRGEAHRHAGSSESCSQMDRSWILGTGGLYLRIRLNHKHQLFTSRSGLLRTALTTSAHFELYLHYCYLRKPS